MTMNMTTIHNGSQLNSQLLKLMMKVIFRVYDIAQVGELNRVKTERLLLLAYGGISFIYTYIHIYIHTYIHTFILPCMQYIYIYIY